MKSFKEVDANRRAYHADATRNSVHRSSLMVPELPGAAAEVSFLNHFLIKRGYDKVACRVTAIDAQGARIESRLHPIDEARVYTIPLTGAFDGDAASYLVEFFAADNLFIPFPAVMVNHRGDGFANTVHAFNRVLNDVFEDDAINETSVAEASIDVALGDGLDTVAYFMAGQQPCRGRIEIELAAGGAIRTATLPVEVPRFGHQALSLHDAFPGVAAEGGVLKIRQPGQFMFYGRLLVAVRQDDGAFTGNHSYYDSSHVPEYWDDAQPSVRSYPFLPDFENVVRMYPIMSPGELAVDVDLFGRDGALLSTCAAGTRTSPGEEFVDFSVDAGAADEGVDRDDVAAFAVRTTPTAGNTPTRVNHQLVHRDKMGISPLAASVNVSLVNRNVFEPEGKPAVTWGQAPVGGGLRSTLGIVRKFPEGDAEPITVRFWSEDGKVAERRYVLPGSGAVTMDLAKELADVADFGPDGPARNIWYEARSSRTDLSAFVASRHEQTGHCTGEHSY